MNFVKTLLEYRDFFHLDNRKILAALDEDGNMIAVGEGVAYKSGEGLFMSGYDTGGSPREGDSLEKQKIELLYLLPGDLKSDEEDRIAAVENSALPLPPGYCVGQIICQEHVFTISSKTGNPSIHGTYEVIRREFHSVPYSYHTRGLTASVLELYYYEVLAESHQLYLEEKTFQQEMKERRKSTKDLKRKQITEKDFHKDTGNQYICEQKVNLWGVTTRIYVTFREETADKKWTLKKCVSQLNTHILWVDEHRKEIGQSLLDSNMVKWANSWVEEYDCVPYPITEKAFLENLYIQSITISYNAPDAAEISFFLDTVPSYFGDHTMQLSVDAKKDIPGTAWAYDIHKAWVAG